MEQFTRQQMFAPVVGAQEVYQATIDLIARIDSFIDQAELLSYLRVCSLIFMIIFVS